MVVFFSTSRDETARVILFLEYVCDHEEFGDHCFMWYFFLLFICGAVKFSYVSYFVVFLYFITAICIC